jgi:hypothetical protein
MKGRKNVARGALALAVVLGCAGCVTRTVTVGNSSPANTKNTSPAAAASTVPPPSPSPVSTAAKLSNTCTAGWAWDSGTGGYDFAPFSGPTSFPSGVQVYGGYQITLTNTSDTTAEAGGFAVVFYDEGTELGSASADVNDEFITPGQSLSWNEETSMMNSGTEGAVGTGDTCALVQWYQ